MHKVNKDIKETLIQEKVIAKKEGVVTDYRPYHISDNLENIKIAKCTN